jgi:polysaccharide deacetylase family protein (PEP-CTERM system associated)
VTRVVNAMTVDVEDYFHASAFDRVVSRSSWAALDSRVVHNTETLLQCFDRAGIHATFFVLGWVAERFPQLVRAIAAGGHEIASHGFHHQLIYLLTPDQFREDVRRAKATIENAAGCTVRGYRAPSFSMCAAACGRSTC